MASIEITGEVVEWRGRAPFHVVRVSGAEAEVVELGDTVTARLEILDPVGGERPGPVRQNCLP